jgi:mRNA-degrading endonuclease toxin of MazEF toxin-antitoxin module
MAERGRLYLWPRNRSFGNSKPRPVLVIAPDAATSRSRRWVVLPLSTDPRLDGQPLALPVEPSFTNGLRRGATS